MMHIDITIVDTANPPVESVEALLWEYMNWGNKQFYQRYGHSFDIAALIENDLQTLDIYSAEQGGRLLLAKIDDKVTGLVGLHKINDDIGEVKRLYVRPEGRGHGIARLMLENLQATAEDMGYSKLRLETTPFMHEAQALYRSLGFREIEPYPETTLPEEIWPVTIFMELDIVRYASPVFEADNYEPLADERLWDWMYAKEVPYDVSGFYRL
jgi:ribosomal protein S18 acetylase RimI-like enzyme